MALHGTVPNRCSGENINFGLSGIGLHWNLGTPDRNEAGRGVFSTSCNRTSSLSGGGVGGGVEMPISLNLGNIGGGFDHSPAAKPSAQELRGVQFPGPPRHTRKMGPERVQNV